MIQTPEYFSLAPDSIRQPADTWHSYAAELNYPVIDESSLQFLETWALLTRPSRILELGCGYGLMSYRLLSVLPGCILTGIDYNPENGNLFRKLAGEGELSGRFIFKAGNVIDLLPEITGKYDWIIVDVDKKFYPELAALLPSKLAQGGYLIADNVLWKGWVTKPGERKNPEPIRIWNKLIFENEDFETLLLPVGDGLTLSRKR